MLRRFLFVILLSLAACIHARAQAPVEGRKLEVGAHFTAIDLEGELLSSSVSFECFAPPCFPIFTSRRHFEPGFGARIGYLVGDYVTVEAELDFLPRDRAVDQGWKLEGLFGAKVGKRTRRVGFFGKGRAGFFHASQGDFRPKPNVGCPAIFPPPISCFEGVGKTGFALDIGGVFEIYPSGRSIIRVDVGDTIIHFGDRLVPIDGRPQLYLGVIPRPARTTHNLQLNAGFGFRF